MNKAYKIIWSHARNCYVVVAEIARNRGKNNVKSVFSRLAPRSVAVAQLAGLVFGLTKEAGRRLPVAAVQPLTAARWIVPLMTVGILLQAVPGFASTITDASGKSLAGTGKVHDLYAQTIISNENVNFGVNRFQRFEISRGDIANMYFRLQKDPASVNSLVNLVKNRIDVQGTVNAVKNNRIGGDLYFLSPDGMAVGKTGVINAGRFVALAPSSAYFTGDIGTEGIWNSDANLAYQFRNDIANFGQRDDKGQFKELKDLAFNTDSKASINIAGRINARSGIVLGGGKIVLENGAILQSQKDLDFTSMVNAKGSNGTQLTAAAFDIGSVTLNPAADDSGDIILRATAANEYLNTPVIPAGQTYNAIFETSNSATVEVKGKIESDGGVDLSADAKTTFDNTTWNSWNISQIGQNLANDLGFNWEADWASKTNTASVTLGNTGSIKAGGDASLQADATVDVKVKAATIAKKEEGTSIAVPVIAIGVAKVKNKALIDVSGELLSEGDMSLAAAATTKANVNSKAAALTKDDADKANQIFVGVSWITGDSIAEVNIKDKKDAQGNSLKITADGDFSAEATSASDMSLTTAVVGMDETFASTGVAVLDYDSAANVNIGRSVDAKSVKAEAENEVSGLSIEASNSNGEGDDRYVGNADNIKWQLNGNTNANVIAQAIKNKFNLSGVTNDGKLKGLKDAFTKAQEYVTAGVGLAVVDTANTALVSVAPDITLKATGPATEKKDNKDVPGGDVSLSANTHMDSLHHAVSGEANKMDDDTASKVTVAAAVLYSAIENDASVELQSDTKNHKGATLESVNGSVNLRADTKQAYDPLEPFKAVPERLEKLLKTLKGLGKEFPELANLHAETVTTKKQAEDGTISEDTARKRFANYSVSFANFLSKEAQNLIALDKGVQGLIDDVSAIFSPASYTNYYVRSYMVDSHDDGGSNVAVGASLNIAKLHNKGIVSIGEKANITAGKGIKIDATTDTNVVSATGNGGEYFAFSESNGSGVGASVAVQDFSGDSLILSGKNVTMNAKGTSAEGGKIAMNAANDMNQTGIILSAGKADSKLSASGSVNVLTGDSNSLVLVDDETTATAAGDFTMSANNNSAVTNIVGGLALGSSKTNASVGAGIAINYLGVNSMAVIGDDGTDASTTDTDTGTDDFKKKTVEEQNKIKAQNTLINARKLAEERATVKKMGTDFALSDKKLNESMGAKTAGSAKGNLSAKGVYVTGNSSGTLNAVALEGASNSENHSGFDTVNKWSKEGAAIKDQGTEAMKNIVDAPLTALDKVFDKSHISVDKAWTFSNLQTIPAPNNDPSTSSFNAAAAGSVSWNKVNSETASVIDNASLNLGKTTSGKLLNAASDDVFSGAWSGAAAVNWFTGGAGSAASPGSHKGALGTALATNNLKRDVDAVISNSTITKAGTIENTVIKNGAEAAAALGIAVTNDSQGTGTNASVAFGLSLNKSDSDIHALMIDDTVSNTNSTGTAINNRAYDGDIQVAGGVDFAFANSANGGRAIAAGITAAVSEIRNNIQSGIQGGTYTGIKDMKVAGEEALTQVNGAVAIGVTASEKGFTGTGSLAYADLDNVNHGYISGTNEISATGEVSVTDRDISGSKDNVYKEYLKQRKEDPTGESYLSSNTKSKLGANAGSAIVNVAVGVSASKGHTAGAAITVGKVANKFSSDITNNKKLMADAVKASADVHTNIVSVGAGASVSTKNFGGAGSLSFDDLDQDNIVSITGNRNGSADGITANTVSGTAENTSHIVNVTGDFAGGKNAAGLGIAYNRMDDTTGVYAANNRIQAKDAAKGVDVSLDAANDAYALALSMGASATYKDDGTVAAHGNFGVNRGHNDTVAVIGEDKDGNGDTATAKRNTISNASSVKAKATDKTSKTTVAGSGELAIKDTTVALGIGVALTESDKGSNAGDGRETVRAEINNADITTVKKNNAAPVISAVTTDESMAATVAVGVGITKKSLIGAQGIGADANIFKNNTAGLKDTTIDKNSGSKEALVTAKAETTSALNTGAAAMQLSGNESFLTGVVAVGVNRIKDTTTAGVTYTDKQNATSMNVGNLDISATSRGDITSVAMGVSGTLKGTMAVGGSGSHNYIENNAAAKIEKANINSTGNVGVVARSDEAISNYAGVLDAAVGGQGLAAAVGVTGSNNKISGNTTALIDNSKVVAKGSDSNKIKTASKLKDNTDDEKYLIDSAVSRNTWSSGSFTEGEGDNKKYGVSRLQKGRVKEEKTGIVVDASATHSIASVMANGGVAIGAGDTGLGASLAGVINLNEVTGSTTAKALDSKLNTADKRSDVNVNAADYTNVAEFSGAASVGIGQEAGIAAGFTGAVNEVSRVTAAGISTSSVKWNDSKKYYESSDTGKEKNTVYAGNFNVTADARQAMSAFNVTGAIAGST
ncbi:MAG: leukotoxin LktA family filamentous adhesin, partial [Acidaminococcaceae bacterium]|nr:leukotoxin LktA family filamentous adhesin [Acidaminococcaceae bacterium]